MRPPPPVVWICTGSAAWRGTRAALAGSATAAVAAWGLGHLSDLQPALSVVALIAGGVAAASAWWLGEDRCGRLNWTGRAWTWQPEGATEPEVVALSIALDLQGAILLRLTPPRRRAAWLLVSRAQDPPNWPRLCATLLAAHPSPDTTR